MFDSIYLEWFSTQKCFYRILFRNGNWFRFPASPYKAAKPDKTLQAQTTFKVTQSKSSYFSNWCRATISKLRSWITEL